MTNSAATPTMFRTFEQAKAMSFDTGLSFVTVKSSALKQRVDMSLYVPQQLASMSHPTNVPIVILLHGVYGSHWAWAMKGAAHLTAQRLIDQGKIAPMVLAMPSDGLWGDGSGYVAHQDKNFEQWIVDEVPAAVGQACNALTAASPIFIAGLSMGGWGALRLAGKYPQRFTAAAAHSAMTEISQFDALVEESREAWSTHSSDCGVLHALQSAGADLPPIRFDCGTEDFLLQANRTLHQALNDANIAHDYAEFPGAHEWSYWSQHLEDSLLFFNRVFKQEGQSV
ncbi:MAG: esterase family protein [Burkholderiaceae bacterium]|nr:esterase family protein [Burkholderiaceae bacterium]